MSRIGFGSAVALVGLCGCLVERKLPDDLNIPCAAQTDCPTGFVCRESLGRCVSAANLDDVGPSLVGAPVVTPATATIDTIVFVALEVSEPLLADPVVGLDTGARLAPLTVNEERTDRDALSYVLSYTVDGSEVAGVHGFTASLVDNDGNAADDLAAGNVVIDFAAPRVVGSQLSASHLASGDEATLVVTFDERPAVAPVVTLVPGGHAFTLQDDGETSLTFRFVATEAEHAPGRYAVLIDAVDEAGNRAGLDPGLELVLDFLAPAVSDVTITPARARPGDVINVTVRFTEDVAALPVVNLEADAVVPMDASAVTPPALVFSFQHLVDAADLEGTYDIVILDAADGAGNAAASTTLGSVVIDKTPPRLSDVAISATEIALDETLRVSFSIDETLSGEPAVTVGDVPMNRIGPGFAYEVVPSSLSASALPIEISATDLVGNVLRETIGFVDVDTLLPDVVDAVITPEDAALGSVVTLAVTADEPLRGPPSLAWATVDPGFVFVSTAGLTHFFVLTVDADAPAGELLLSGIDLEDLAGNLATRAVSSTLRMDPVPPRVELELVGGTRYSAQSGHNVIDVIVTGDADVDEIVGELAATGTGAIDGVLLVCDAPPLPVTCSVALDGDETPGLRQVAITARDRAGNGTLAATIVTLDFTEPSVIGGSVGLQLAPPAGSVLASVQAIGPGGRATVSLLVDEPLGATPRLFIEGNEVSQAAGDGPAYAFAIEQRTLSIADGSYTPQLLLVDDVGNQVTQPLPEAAVRFDTTPPAAPITHDGFIYRRVPWGTSASGGAPRMAVDVDRAQLAADDTVIVFSADEPPRLELGRLTLAQSTASEVELVPTDRATVFVAIADTAANLSPAIATGHIEWSMSMRGKIAGSTFENPHTFTARGRLAEARDSDRGVEVGEALAADTEGAARWTELDLQTRPSARSNHVVVRDSLEGGVVMFGGNSGGIGNFSETWRWNDGWQQLAPSTSPPALQSPGMVFDEVRGRVMLFGGSVTAGATNDTWVLTGGAWRKLDPPLPLPTKRSRPAMAFDSRRGRTVLFGGCCFGGEFTDTWEHDGTEWTLRDTSAGSPAKGFFSAAFDAARGVTVLFGAAAGAPPQTWTWDGVSWTQLTPDVAPPDRILAAVAYDAGRERVVLFGGSRGNSVLNDTWEWDGEVWRERSPVHRPPTRRGHALAYDAERGGVLLVGGEGDPTDVEPTWLFDGEDWRRLVPSFVPTGFQAPVHGAEVAYDARRQRVVLVGTRGDFSANETWEWDGAEWTFITTTPPEFEGRQLPAIAYDGTHTVLFGGRSFPDGVPNFPEDTWLWDGATWTRAEDGVFRPQGRMQHSMALDETRQRVVLFGGFDGTQLRDTAEWDGTRWHPTSPSTTPVVSDPSLVFDGTGVMLFGRPPSGTRDTWAWDGSNWIEKFPTRHPPPRVSTALVFDRSRNSVFLFGGHPGLNEPFADTWEWDGSTWTALTPGISPPGRTHGAFVANAEGLHLFGGEVNNRQFTDQWSFTSGAEHRPAHVVEVAFATATTGDVVIDDVRAAWAGSAQGDTPGAQLLLWDGGAWRRVATTTDGTALRYTLRADPAFADLDDEVLAERVERLFVGSRRTLTLALAPLDVGGDHPTRGVVSSDDVEVVIRYRSP